MAKAIVPATDALLAQIGKWLKQENEVHEAALAALGTDFPYDDEIPSKGFWCNWNIVTRSASEDPTNVHVLVDDGDPVGFVCALDILEVRPDRRGMGYGRDLAEFMLTWAIERNFSVVEIGIAPYTAVPFWRAIGFTTVPDRSASGGGQYAYKRLDRRSRLGSTPVVPYRIAFYPDERGGAEDVKPFVIFENYAERLFDGRLQLSERAYCFNPNESAPHDCVVQIEVEGRVIFRDKAKRPEAQAFGVERDGAGIYYIDRIVIR
jgi:GNAT superfamily N-acetyltransferase